MNVESVFTPSIVCTRRSASVLEAARLMKRNHVGALLVNEDLPHSDRPVGVVTDRDLVIKALAEDRSPQQCTVGEVMTPSLVTVLRSDTLQHALGLMRNRGVRRLAVAEPGGKLAGMVSLDDIVDALAGELAALHGILSSELTREISQTPQWRKTHFE